MADRQVLRTGKDQDGDITALCGEWGRAEKMLANMHINARDHRYFVLDANRGEVDVKVATGRNGPHLRTDDVADLQKPPRIGQETCRELGTGDVDQRADAKMGMHRL